MTEEWKDIPGYEGKYKASTEGRIYSVQGRRCLKPRTINKYGHHMVALYGGDRSVKNTYPHQLVLKTFVGPCPEGMEGCHSNGDPTDDRLENVRWDTHKNNMADCARHGRMPDIRGEKSGSAKLTNDNVKGIRASRAPTATLAVRYNVSGATIRRVKTRKIWKHI